MSQLWSRRTVRPMGIQRGAGALVSAAVVVAALACASAAQADITVTTTADDTTTDGQCTLREAVGVIDGTPSADCPGAAATGTTTVHLPAGTFALASGELHLSGAARVVIAGASTATTTLD